jgi:micrococcal nuclease
MLVLLAFVALSRLPAPEATTVAWVADGDTLTVRSGEKTVRVRLHGIDAPEGDQPFGDQSKQSLTELAQGKRVTLQVMDTDRYGRTVAVVWQDGLNLNAEQVRRGMAWWYERYAPNDRELSWAQGQARRARRGLWSDRDPTPPWEWRAAAREP